MSTLQQHVADFLSAVSETPHLWRSIDVRIIALRVNNDWHNLVARFYLHPAEPSQVPRPVDFPQLAELAVLQEVHPPDQLGRLIEDVERGELLIQGRVIRFNTDEDTGLSRSYAYSSARIGKNISEVVHGSYRYGHLLMLTYDQASRLYNNLPRGEEGLNAALRGLLDPWGGVSEILRHALGETMGFHGQSNRRVSFIAPLQARIISSDCVLVDGVLSYTLKAGSRTAGESCTLVITGDDVRGMRVARPVPLLGRRWVKDAGEFRHSGVVTLRGAKHLKLTLRLSTFEPSQTDVEASPSSLPLLLTAFKASSCVKQIG